MGEELEREEKDGWVGDGVVVLVCGGGFDWRVFCDVFLVFVYWWVGVGVERVVWDERIGSMCGIV